MPTPTFLGKPVIWPRPCSSCSQTPRSPEDAPHRSVTSVAFLTRALAIISFSKSCATRQGEVSTRSLLLARRKPSLPVGKTAIRNVVREACALTEPPTLTSSATSFSEILAVRRSASLTIATFVGICCEISRCCQLQPPQPAATNLHGGATRCADGLRISTMFARAKSFLFVVISIAICSPVIAPLTKTTRPSANRAKPSPPATMRSMVTFSLFIIVNPRL